MDEHNNERAEILARKLKKMFPDEGERKIAEVILNEYGTESYEQESMRVRLAILKLSENTTESIKKNTRYAKEDFRDVLSWAEYPKQSKNRAIPDRPKKQKLVEMDRIQYEEWLRED